MARTDAQVKQCMDACYDFHAMCLWMAMTHCIETIHEVPDSGLADIRN